MVHHDTFLLRIVFIALSMFRTESCIVARLAATPAQETAVVHSIPRVPDLLRLTITSCDVSAVISAFVAVAEKTTEESTAAAASLWRSARFVRAFIHSIIVQISPAFRVPRIS